MSFLSFKIRYVRLPPSPQKARIDNFGTGFFVSLHFVFPCALSMLYFVEYIDVTSFFLITWGKD